LAGGPRRLLRAGATGAARAAAGLPRTRAREGCPCIVIAEH